MSWLERLWPAKQTATVGAPTSLDVLRAMIAGGYGSAAGVTVNWKTALQVATVLACARVIAEGIAQVPCKVFRADRGSRFAAPEHALYRLLYRRPNGWQTAFEFREMMGLHLALAGNFFAFVNRGVGGALLELLPLEPGWVTVKRGAALGDAPTYEVRPQGGAAFTATADQIWHVRGLSWDGLSGMDAVKLAREAIGLGMASERYGAKFFAEGGQPLGILTAPVTAGPETVKDIREGWQAFNEGKKTAVVGGGVTYQAVSSTNEAGQFVETRRQQVEEICRAFRVMPIMVGFADKTATYASAEQMFLAHVVHTLMPWYERIEQSAEVNLLSDEDQAAGYYVKLLPNALMRGAAKDRGEFYAKALGAGGSPAWMTQDEIRELEELNPFGGSAAALPVPTNVGGAAPATQE
jgi:HK97 family phage portal protein